MIDHATAFDVVASDAVTLGVVVRRTRRARRLGLTHMHSVPFGCAIVGDEADGSEEGFSR
ncbi:hypothetical protein ACWFNE_06955 [Cellulomonas sp. NPDC055163]